MQPEPSDETTDLLVAYALGALEPEEMARVGRLLDERPELRAQLAELRATAAMLPYGLPAGAPPPDLRQRVLDRAAGRGGPAAARPEPDLGRRLRGWIYALGGLAAATLAALALALSQLSGARAELAEARQQLAQAQQRLAAVERQVAAVGSERANLAQAVVGAEVLAKLQGPGGEATVLQSAGGELLVAARLPPLAPDRVYQLWLVGEGEPQSGGVFVVDGAGYGLIALGPGAPSGVTLAVTAEPAPGSPGPTSDPLVAGAIT